MSRDTVIKGLALVYRLRDALAASIDVHEFDGLVHWFTDLRDRERAAGDHLADSIWADLGQALNNLITDAGFPAVIPTA